MEIGKTTLRVYPWSISGNWWLNNNMNEYCLGVLTSMCWPTVNGHYLPNSTRPQGLRNRAFHVLGV